MKTLPRVAIAPLSCILLLALAACGSSAAKGAPPRTHASTAQDGVVHVAMLNHAGYNPYVFSPRTITVKVGTRVVWRNRSSADHTVTASTSPAAFDSGTARLIHPKAQWSFVFRRPGRYAYYCLLHPFMKGIVIVTQ